MAQFEGAKPAKVPWIIQEAFPGYHGVVWYSRDFTVPENPHTGGRTFLRFGQVDYLAEVWLNGVPVGGHEGGETPFVIDVTDAIKPGRENHLSVRVLNPTAQPIDGILLKETARRCKVEGKFSAGGSYNHGGITESVELLYVPSVYVEDLFAWASVLADTGKMHVRLGMRNATHTAQKTQVAVTVSSARSGETTATFALERELPAGTSQIEADLPISNPHLWNLNDPYLYRVTARLSAAGATGFAERSTRCGFREFRFSDGCFRLNGKRLYLKSTHTCNHFPIGLQFPRDPDMLRRDLLNLKVMGFNMVRFIWGAATPAQLDLCDEIGLLVYEESYAAWPIAPSPKMAERFDAAVRELVVRDRNHPSIVIWGLLNETPDGPVFQHAVAMLPLVRTLDPGRMVLLNSGRWDNKYSKRSVRGTFGGVPGFQMWSIKAAEVPWVALNTTPGTVSAWQIDWPSKQLALHPGPQTQSSAIRWTAPDDGDVKLSAKFIGLAERVPTTDVHILYNGRALFDSVINLDGAPNEACFTKTVSVKRGDTLDAVVGSGDGKFSSDTTGLDFSLTTGRKIHDAAADFSDKANPNGVWSYGWISSPVLTHAAAFTRYSNDEDTNSPSTPGTLGSLSNPGSFVWEDVLDDYHCYPRVPHAAGDIQTLRTYSGGGEKPLFLSEYGIGSAVDLWRATRHFEQEKAEGLEDAQYFRDKLDRFLADWKNWRLDETFVRPEDFFMESIRKMAGQRTLGLNAIRANPRIAAYSLTGATDHVMTGEGLTTLFRELKPGTVDAMFDGWYPLRWCLFAESAHIFKGGKIRLEAVLADEDSLTPGDYPARLQVVGPRMTRVMDRVITVTVPERGGAIEPPFARLWFSEDVTVDGPAGEYRFLATFERGAAAAGGQATFFVSDPADLPSVSSDVVLWGDDPHTAKWLAEHGVSTRAFEPGAPGKCEVILACLKPAAPGGAAAFRELAKRIASGSTVIFLSPEIFSLTNQPTAWLPLNTKGTVSKVRGWLYLKDEWAKRHPIFEGLQAGGLMDYTFYRELIPDLVFTGQEPPAEAVAGAIKASQDYDSGLMMSVYTLGQGRFILNTLRIRENLTSHPAAGRLLLNLLCYAAKGIDRPPVALPADFERELDDLGYVQSGAR